MSFDSSKALTHVVGSFVPNIRPDSMQNTHRHTHTHTHTHTHKQNNKKLHRYLLSEKINRNVKYAGIVSIQFQRPGSVVILKNGFDNQNRTSFHSCLQLVKP